MYAKCAAWGERYANISCDHIITDETVLCTGKHGRSGLYSFPAFFENKGHKL